MNWDELFKSLIELNLLNKAIKKVEINEDFQISTIDKERIEINLLKDGETKGTVYDFRGKIMYSIKFEDEIISVGKVQMPVKLTRAFRWKLTRANGY